MPDDERPRSIYEAIAMAKARIGYIGKDDKNKDLGYSFRGIDSILNKAGPVATELGIVTAPQTRLVSSEEVHSSSGTRGYRVVVETVWTFSVHVERDEGDVRFPHYSSLVAQTLGEAIDYSDKAVNKATRQSEKNAWQQVFSIPTGEPDPDAETPTQYGRQEPGPTTGEEVLSALTLEGFTDIEAKHYARQAMHFLGVEHPIPVEKVAGIIGTAKQLKLDSEAVFEDDDEEDEEDPSSGY